MTRLGRALPGFSFARDEFRLGGLGWNERVAGAKKRVEWRGRACRKKPRTSSKCAIADAGKRQRHRSDCRGWANVSAYSLTCRILICASNDILQAGELEAAKAATEKAKKSDVNPAVYIAVPVSV